MGSITVTWDCSKDPVQTLHWGWDGEELPYLHGEVYSTFQTTRLWVEMSDAPTQTSANSVLIIKM